MLRLLDLYCGGGLGADGYAAVGFDLTGVDLFPMPDYPYPFVQADALEYLRQHGDEYDVIHASPPCQLFTRAKHLREAQGSTSKETLDLLTPTLALLRERFGHLPWVVENVENARPLMEPRGGESLARCCGSSFGLQVQRHRLFLSNRPLTGTRCAHERFPIDPTSGKPRPWGVYHVPGDSIPSGGRTARNAEHGAEVMGLARVVPWAVLKEGFPPAYTVWIGSQLIREEVR